MWEESPKNLTTNSTTNSTSVFGNNDLHRWKQRYFKKELLSLNAPKVATESNFLKNVLFIDWNILFIVFQNYWNLCIVQYKIVNIRDVNVWAGILRNNITLFYQIVELSSMSAFFYAFMLNDVLHWIRNGIIFISYDGISSYFGNSVWQVLYSLF